MKSYELTKNKIVPFQSYKVMDFGTIVVCFSVSSDKKGVIACAYKEGKSSKPFWYYKFRDLDHLIDFSKKSAKAALESKKEKIRRKEEQKVLKEKSLSESQIGDIWHSSYGYDQTTNQFYQVVGIKGKRLQLRRISKNVADTGFMSGRATPVKDEFVSNIIEKQISAGYIKMGISEYASKVTNFDQSWYESWYA